MPTKEATDRMIESARVAAERGERILHLQIEISKVNGEPSSFGSSGGAFTNDDTVGSIVSYIETLGWTLEHTGYSFVETGSTTSAKMFGTGEGRVNEGVVLGFFTFRRAEPAT